MYTDMTYILTYMHTYIWMRTDVNISADIAPATHLAQLLAYVAMATFRTTFPTARQEPWA